MKNRLTPGLNQRTPKHYTDPRKWLLSRSRSTEPLLLAAIPAPKDPAETAHSDAHSPPHLGGSFTWG